MLIMRISVSSDSSRLLRKDHSSCPSLLVQLLNSECEDLCLADLIVDYSYLDLSDVPDKEFERTGSSVCLLTIALGCGRSEMHPSILPPRACLSHPFHC
jgi:hypothetical protein